MTAAAQSQPPAPAVRFSVLIPVYDVRPFIDDCLGSVLAQTYGAWECLCVDDGSRDGTGARLDDYARKDPRIRVTHQRNGGVSRARNRALSRARGEFIVFLDSDDLWLTDCLLEEAASHSGYDLALFDVRRVDETFALGQKDLCGGEEDGWRIETYDWSERLPFLATNLAFWQCIVRADVTRGLFFDESLALGEDRWWILQVVMRCGRVLHFCHLCHGYRRRLGSAVHGGTKPGHELDAVVYASRSLRLFAEGRKVVGVGSILNSLDVLTKLFVVSMNRRKLPEVWGAWFDSLGETCFPKGTPWLRRFCIWVCWRMRSPFVARLVYAVPSSVKRALQKR